MPDIKSESTPFKVKRTTLNVNKFLEKDESSSATLGKVDGEESGVGNLARIVRHSRIKINNNEKKITHLKNIHNLRKENVDKKLEGSSPLMGVMESIAERVDSIRESLIKSSDSSSKGRRRREQEQARRQRAEDKLESKKRITAFSTIGDKILSPVKSLWGKIWDFIKAIFLGKVVFAFLDWLKDPANQKKVGNFVRFVKDWWPALVAGVLLFGTGFGTLVTGLTLAITLWIPKMVAAIAALNPWVVAAAGLGITAALLSTKKNKTDEKVDQSVEDKGRDETVDQLRKEKESKNMLERLGGFFTGEGQERDEQIQRIETGTEKRYGFFGELDQPAQFNKGGQVPGSGSDDTVPAMLTPGETVLQVGARERMLNTIGVDPLAFNLGPNANKPTSGPVQHFERGGMAGGVADFMTGGMWDFDKKNRRGSPKDWGIRRIAGGLTDWLTMGLTDFDKRGAGALQFNPIGGGEDRKWGGDKVVLSPQQKGLKPPTIVPPTPGTAQKSSVVAYNLQKEGDQMGTAEKTKGSEIPSFEVTVARSPHKIRTLGITV